jgi:hypothetical protein
MTVLETFDLKYIYKMENSTLEHFRYPIGDLSHQQSIQENI